MPYYLGIDLGGTKTHSVITNKTGKVVGFGGSGPGNHQNVGYDGMYSALHDALQGALATADIDISQIERAGFGIAGFDWPYERPEMEATIDRLGLKCNYNLTNDAIPGLVAGAEQGWGVVVVSGTGCNCRGWNPTRTQEGRVTGYGTMMGEGAGGTELVFKAMQYVGYSWTKRLPPTILSEAFTAHTGARDIEDLIEGYTEYRYHVNADAAPIVFKAAKQGDHVAQLLVNWAGGELGEMANAVIRQLSIESIRFEVVLSGSMFEGGAGMVTAMERKIHELAPNAKLVRLSEPPVIGAVLIALMDDAISPTRDIRRTLSQSFEKLRENHVPA